MFDALRNLFQRLRGKSSAPSSTEIIPILPAKSIPKTTTAACSGAYVFADIETTGLNHNGEDEIVEIAIVDTEGNTLLNTLVRPVRKLSWSDAQAIHGISPQDVSAAPTLDVLLPKIAAICLGKTVVFYNARFDLSFFPKRFFPSIACAMRCYSVASSTLGWTKLMDAALETGYDPAGRQSHRALPDALACRHVWLCGIPFMANLLPLRIDSSIIAKLNVEGSNGISLVFDEFFPDEMILVSVNDRCALWTKDHLDLIYAYHPHAPSYGHGKIATLSKFANPKLTELLASGHDAEMRLIERSHDLLTFEVIVTVGRKTTNERPIPSTPVTLSLIDDDIYKCFIAYHSGMCDAIGTWDDFRKVEIEIARLCKERSGRYYKSKAKGAKFAIIFSPERQTSSDVWELQQDGYKVTTFDLAVEFFGLEGMWDNSRYTNYTNHVKRVQECG